MPDEKYRHPSKDLLLSALGSIDSQVGKLVRAFPGSSGIAADGAWLDKWFAAECASDGDEQAKNGDAAVPPDVEAELKHLLSGAGATVTKRLSLKSIRPQHFRGYRALAQTFDLSGTLVVIEGRNSAGKTSLAEALEWLFTGQLQRRLDQEQGNSKELADCIQSQVRPAGAETFVEAVFGKEDGTTIAVRRTLVTDYGEASTSRCVSRVTMDGTEVSAAQAERFFNEHFAGVPPLLMQHTLRHFVHSGPTQRREYFERLLSMNEITALIEKAVVGDAKLKELLSPTGSRQLGRWAAIITTVRSARARKLLRAVDGSAQVAAAQAALLAYAQDDFAAEVPAEYDFVRAREALEATQLREREAKFPLLKRLAPARTLDLAAQEALKAADVAAAFQLLMSRGVSLREAHSALTTLSEVERTLSPAIQSLVSAGLLDREAREQTCPLCETTSALSAARVARILNVNPLVQAHSRAQSDVSEAASSARQLLSALQRLVEALIPQHPSDPEWDAAIAAAPERLADAARQARRDLGRAFSSIQPFANAITTISRWLSPVPQSPESPPEAVQDALAIVESSGDSVIATVQAYASAFDSLAAEVGTSAADASAYAARQTWLDLAQDLPELLQDLKWESKKKDAQAALAAHREKLILIRQYALELRRREFSAEMHAVWSSLRRDRYSQFRDLHIPPPSGRGYPVSIQVRATLDDGTLVKHVDALRVFSESQVHVLGLAAFLTRSKLLGHPFIVLDDPVQSMDEEHFKTFAEGLTNSLLDSGIQLVILTHNDTFARDLSWAHSHRADFVSIALAHSRKKGCFASDDNRRVQDRLKSAERRAEDGDLKGAWYLIRVAVERLYTLVKIRSDKEFAPDSWRSTTAEDMWNQGVGDIVEAAVPGSGRELKRILAETAAGAHDKAPRGLADVVSSCGYLRGLLNPLRVGG